MYLLNAFPIVCKKKYAFSPKLSRCVCPYLFNFVSELSMARKPKKFVSTNKAFVKGSICKRKMSHNFYTVHVTSYEKKIYRNRPKHCITLCSDCKEITKGSHHHDFVDKYHQWKNWWNENWTDRNRKSEQNIITKKTSFTSYEGYWQSAHEEMRNFLRVERSIDVIDL